MIGFDAGKKVEGRKRYLVAETLGLLWAVAIPTARAHDHRSTGAWRHAPRPPMTTETV